MRLHAAVLPHIPVCLVRFVSQKSLERSFLIVLVSSPDPPRARTFGIIGGRERKKVW